jgi:hypothetical protein
VQRRALPNAMPLGDLNLKGYPPFIHFNHFLFVPRLVRSSRICKNLHGNPRLCFQCKGNDLEYA